MAAEYYEISREEMADCLESKGFKLVTETRAVELVYQWEHPKAPGLAVRVYTSIAHGKARKAGADAIRCVYWSTELAKPFATTKRIHRILNWDRNLTLRLRVMAGSISKMEAVSCPECGAPMNHRKKKGSYDFYGCLRFPDCRGSRETDEVTEYLKETEEAALRFLKEAGKVPA